MTDVSTSYQKNNIYGFGDNSFITDGNVVYYVNMKKSLSYPICNKSGCNHNNVDECGAIFSDEVFLECVNVYKNQLIVAGSNETSINLYKADLDGSNHEKIASINYKKDMEYLKKNNIKNPTFEINTNDYLVDNNKLYICLNVEDITNVEQLNDGTMTNGPTVVMLYSLDLDTGDITKISEINDEIYWVSVNLRYVMDNNIYMDIKALKCKPEECANYDGELTNENNNSDIVEHVNRINMVTGEIKKEDLQYCFDYIGSRYDEHWFMEIDEDYNFTGRVYSRDYNGAKDKIITLEEIEKIPYSLEYRIIVTNNGFVYEIEKQDLSGVCYQDISIYDAEGNMEQVVNKSDYAVAAGFDNYYILTNGIWNTVPNMYIEQEAVGKKAVDIYQH